MKLTIIVPAFNESAVIRKVLKSLPTKLKGVAEIETVLINDGSTDETFSEAESVNVTILSHVLNRGLGAAIRTGLEWSKKSKSDIAITFDGDGQHDSQDISKVIGPVLKKRADFVIGTRFKRRSKAPVDRIIINWIANLVTFALSGTFTTDSQSGLRVFSKKAINLVDFKSDRMEFSSEILLEAKRNNLKIKEVPISAIYTPYSRKKGQRNLNAIPVFTRFLIRFLR